MGVTPSSQFRNTGFAGVRRKSAKELCSERGFSFLSDFLTVKGKDTDFSLHKKICKPEQMKSHFICSESVSTC